MDNNNNNTTNTFIIGTIIGGAIGAITALLLAPKSGKELRQDIADKSSEVYGKANEYYHNTSEKVSDAVKNTYNTSIDKAQEYMHTAKDQANNFMSKAGETFNNVKNQANIVKDAAKESINTFKSEVNKTTNPE